MVVDSVDIYLNGVLMRNGAETNMHILNGMEITANRKEVLATLKKNREDHEAIVKEARVIYIQRARDAVTAKLDQLSGEDAHKVTLSFSISPPHSHKKVYNVAIKMLDMHQGETIVLDSDQVKNLIMDKWNWQEEFLAQTVGFSERSRGKFADLYGDD